MTEYGIDVSYHNGGINWPAVRADGITFATIKATSGEASGGTDSPAYFRAQAPAMARAIPLCGGYHWLKPVSQTPAPVQVRTFIDVLQQGLGGYEGRLIQLDVEEGQPSDVRAWIAEWNRVTNHYPVALYLPRWLESGWAGSTMGGYGAAAWWSSMYVTGGLRPYRTVAAEVPASFWNTYDGAQTTLLQFTSTARINGVGGNCDVNAYRGTLAQLTALLTREDDMPTAQEIAAAVWTYQLARPDAFDDGSGHHAGEALVGAVNGSIRSAKTLARLDAVATTLGVIAADVDQAEELGAQGITATREVAALVSAIQANDWDALAARLEASQRQSLTDALQRIHVSIDE